MAPSPRGDPPASLKQVSRRGAAEPPLAPAVIKISHEDDVSRMTGRNDTDLPRPPSEIARMFLQSPMGYDALQKGEEFCDVKQVKQLVDFFVATSLKQDLSEEIKMDVAFEIVKSASGAGSPKKVIDLSGYEPKTFNFDVVDDNASKKTRPTPESMFNRGGSRKMPPRPDAGRSGSKSRPPRPSPRAHGTPKGNIMIVGGPSDNNDHRSLGGDEKRIAWHHVRRQQCRTLA